MYELIALAWWQSVFYSSLLFLFSYIKHTTVKAVDARVAHPGALVGRRDPFSAH